MGMSVGWCVIFCLCSLCSIFDGYCSFPFFPPLLLLSSMELLAEACLFRHELLAPSYEDEPQCIRMMQLQAMARKGYAKLIPQEGFVSVSVKASEQGKVGKLPCGARTLLLDEKTGAIKVRGVNKFFDLDEVSRSWMEDNQTWTSCTVLCQRKLAGFVVTLFSLDGEKLGVMSKHVCGGTHVEVATRLLNKLLSPTQQANLASDLFHMHASASLECIAPTEDYGHPVLECAAYHDQLVLFSVQKTDSIRELAYTYTQVQTLAAWWGLPCVDATVLHSKSDLQYYMDSVGQWDTTRIKPFGEVAEGFVILLQVPQTDKESQICFPIRLKLKTTKYITIRALRSLLLGDSNPKVLLYHEAFLQWYTRRGSREALLEEIRAKGVYHLCQQFEADLASRKRERGESTTVQEGLVEMLRYTSRQVHTADAPLITVLLCGLPGSGKSTLSRGILQHYTSSESSFHYGVHLCKDEIHAKLVNERGIDMAANKHKKRRLLAALHKEMQKQVRSVASFCCSSAQPTLLLIDACNATPEARETWINCLGTTRSRVLTVYLMCDSTDVLHARMVARQQHPLIDSPEVAGLALETVVPLFVPPPVLDALQLNSGQLSIEEQRSTVLEHIESIVNKDSKFRQKFSATTPIASSTVSTLEDAASVKVLQAVFGSTVQPGLMAQYTQRARQTDQVVYAASLSMTEEDLLNRVQAVLTSLLKDSTPQLQGGAMAAVWSRVKGALFGAQPTHTEVAAGHLRWLPGWLFQRQDHNCQPTNIKDALRSRFNMTPHPHVTLFYAPIFGEDTEKKLTSTFLTQSAFQVGQPVECTLEELYMDRQALCLKAMVEEHCTQWSMTEARVPLHVTVGVGDKVKPAYAGELFHLFETWEKENQLLEQQQHQEKDNAVKRSQSKYHNFVQIRFTPPIQTSATVVKLS
ncbi:RNA ligase/AAA domain containing protein, putative [Angomonas deanei]|uniref:RNA ligase/AAA domain containing protein, putative n=1 Tax=Angomonas deanei TaxID=59799 RepID=A0A7G2C292_9TRYP|nr:RNA ligase/AAA domain containing protein, putative [Angomonas deanei]